MLDETFIHIPGIGPKTEEMIWGRGIHTWEDFLHSREVVVSPERDELIIRELELSLLHRKDPAFFSERLPQGEMWRTFHAFRDRAVYLDIETTGFYRGTHEITVIGAYDGAIVNTFINGINLNDFERAVSGYDLVVTFNGATFDLPFIRSTFPGITLPPAHIDLRFLFKRLGYTGGLKRIEKALGIDRGPDICGIDGFEAVRLWYRYCRGDRSALETLIEYNRADILNLKPLMEMGYKEMKKRHQNPGCRS
ncbi:MAG: ribonuclease H-like domain-containing protein [Deltaproteobacteria bacterium]|nr:ribonuclease H-like domain-containing protein [Deltaproteobacteria bacterium]MBW2049738.1 ribonuclease H-like domain-containing protein [Deltaproteobacteria bacterium]MBW2110822.1 ribonuclease H-like domain-containing protein [Deltaproteobacteria bacterium]MBW2354413.1 ribonuclease H-like domain-containing protein [Deltaproteobacteria bacterium]